MYLTTKGRYAVMAMVDMVKNNIQDTPVTLATIAARQNIPLNYLEQIFIKLKKQQLVQSVRGPGGGYKLASAADQIRISSIILAVDESIAITRCENDVNAGCMQKNTRCLTHDLWEGLSNHIHAYLQHFSLRDICDNKIDPTLPLQEEATYKEEAYG